jgi:hypothetical protein
MNAQNLGLKIDTFSCSISHIAFMSLGTSLMYLQIHLILLSCTFNDLHSLLKLAFDSGWGLILIVRNGP